MLGASELTYRLVEQPAVRLGRRLAAGRRVAVGRRCSRTRPGPPSVRSGRRRRRDGWRCDRAGRPGLLRCRASGRPARTACAAAWRLLAKELGAFGVVGAVCFLLDVGLFQVLYAVVGVDAVLAKLLATLVSMTAAYVGHRYWSFSHRARTGLRREYLLLRRGQRRRPCCSGLAIVAFVRYPLGQESALVLQAANIASIGLGTVDPLPRLPALGLPGPRPGRAAGRGGRGRGRPRAAARPARGRSAGQPGAVPAGDRPRAGVGIRVRSSSTWLITPTVRPPRRSSSSTRHHRVERLRVERAEALVDEQGVDLHAAALGA